MREHMNIILRAFVYVFMIVCVEASKEFKDVGSEVLRHYDFYDWLICLLAIGAAVGITLNAFFSTAFSSHLENLKAKTGNTDFWRKTILPAQGSAPAEHAPAPSSVAQAPGEPPKTP